MGVEPCNFGFLQKQKAREKVMELSEQYGLKVNPDDVIENNSRNAAESENSQDAFRDNENLIFDEPTACIDAPRKLTS